LAGPKVLDSWALLCYLEKEAGFEKVVHLFGEATESSEPVLMGVVYGGGRFIAGWRGDTENPKPGK
jgi:hypothetical protein